MTRVVEVPAQFDDRTFDQFARSYSADGGGRMLFDAHATQWASPFGLVGLLTAGQAIHEAGGERPLLTLPQDRDVAHYWGRSGFLQHAEPLFELHGKAPRVAARGDSDVLLEITPLNPIDHELVFESFSSSRRGSFPPVELIISDEKKERFVSIVRARSPSMICMW